MKRTAIAVLLVVVSAFLIWTPPAQASVKKIVVEKKVSPAFEGASFGAAGQYETLAGRAFGELDPNDPRNAIITDIRLAPRNRNGLFAASRNGTAPSANFTACETPAAPKPITITATPTAVLMK